MKLGNLIAIVFSLIALAGVGVVYTQVHKEGTLGVSSGPDSTNPYYSVNGVRHWMERKALATATTTVCALKTPNATTTLAGGAVRFGVSSTTASTVTLAKATTPYATTTSLGVCSIGANAQGTCVASTTPTGPLDPSQVFAPNTYLVVGMAGGTGTFSPTGACEGDFTEI